MFFNNGRSTNPKTPPVAGRLTLDRVCKRFAKSEYAADENITLDCRPGEFVVVVGPSGSGKTTLLNIAAGMTRPDGGSASLDGVPITRRDPTGHGLSGPWTVSLADRRSERRIRIEDGRRGASERADRVAESLRMVHLPSSSEKLVHELSGGMRRRIAIAPALVMNPAVLLMDERFPPWTPKPAPSCTISFRRLWCQTQKDDSVRDALGRRSGPSGRPHRHVSRPSRPHSQGNLRPTGSSPNIRQSRHQRTGQAGPQRDRGKRSIVSTPWRKKIRGSLRSLLIWGSFADDVGSGI